MEAELPGHRMPVGGHGERAENIAVAGEDRTGQGPPDLLQKDLRDQPAGQGNRRILLDPGGNETRHVMELTPQQLGEQDLLRPPMQVDGALADAGAAPRSRRR
ncbi:hypothetical protein [Streptomyces botrytidirepellens]|uniref:Uncharacterized protein n=1 Tax=Streptomyces botrytidirepellens TaxID=2486417 RepID=A0A3M8WHG5_9ACTN|nr:hypothetical protein [Streptomyces botrytidirepellens]RNG28810.1 hypothetical protein EEJ42_11790 [Streptomyces botrytidirepellens]